ncbi:15-hydroxyprostaglandin dehydrogenase [NAD(+)]-like [Liolophura sinensis]|uniref:15-hydroxyprostaglandin dehydrogenase [NAD(+)]-like n=1 Tax=Liolophura sinensis TaxID=3198878 RepID=UPI003157F820
MQLTGKVALVTGGAQGIGKGLCEALLKKGAKVCVTDLNPEQGETTVKEFTSQHGDGKAIFIQCDVTSQEQMDSAFSKCKETFGNIDIVCNNAGLGHEIKWELTVDINLKGVIRGTLLGIQYLRKDKGGKGGAVINMSSSAGLTPVPFAPVYCATKHAVLGFTKSWALHPDQEAMGVRFLTVCPSFVETPLIHCTDHGEMYHPDKARQFMQKTGIMSVDFVADSMIKLLEDDTNNGAVMKLTKASGVEFK